MSFAARQKASEFSAVSDEPPYGTQCRERAPSTTSKGDSLACGSLKNKEAAN